jgi:hypothetical protein
VKFLKLLTVPPEELTAFPGNAKEHDDDELDGSANRFGQFRSVLARKLEDGQLQLLAGHGTTAALMRSGLSKVRVELIECDDDTAIGIVVADNAIGRRAGFNESALATLLGRLDEGGGFAGTGVTSAEYDDLLAKLAESAATPLPLTESADDNTWRAATAQDERDRYETKGTRTVSFDYSYPVFVWLAEQLAILREEHEVESNSELFVLMVERWTDSKAPESLDDPAGPDDPEDDDSETLARRAAGDMPGVAADPSGLDEFVNEPTGAQADRIEALARAHEEAQA